SRAPLDGDRLGAPRVRTRVPRIRTAARDSHRQRSALRDLGGSRLVASQRLVDAARYRASTHSSGVSARERRARADAPDVETARRQTGPAHLRGATEAVRRVPARVQHRAPARSAGPRDAGESLSIVNAPVSSTHSRSRIPGALPGEAG